MRYSTSCILFCYYMFGISTININNHVTAFRTNTISHYYTPNRNGSVKDFSISRQQRGRSIPFVRWYNQQQRQQYTKSQPNSRLSMAFIDNGGQVISDGFLWTLRIVSAIVTYIGCVSYFDRPRGILNIEEGVQVEIRQSNVPGAGLGLFAKTDLPQGTILGTYPGVVIPLQQNLNKLRQYPACEGYIWRFSDNKSVIDPTNPEGKLDMVCYGGNPSLPGSVFVMRNVFQLWNIPTTLCRINEPPRGFDVNVITSEDCTTRQVTFEVESTIYAGEELYIDYGLSYDRSMYGSGVDGGTPKQFDE